MFKREPKPSTPPESAPPPADPGPAEHGAGEAEAASSQLQSIRAELDALNGKYLRTLADYHNSQRRAASNEREARQQGIAGVVQAVLPVLDHFELALGQDAATATAEQIVDGVKVIRDELLKVLQAQGVTVVKPGPNDEFDPTRHQAVMQEVREGIEPGRIVGTLQAGYVMGDRIVRPAMVSVARAE